MTDRLLLHVRSFARPSSDGTPGGMAFDTGVSRAVLERVAAGRAPASLRLYRPGDALAFGGLDRTRPGFARAVAAARAQGFEPLLRLAGGRAAVFHDETLAFAWAVPEPDARRGVQARFDTLAGIVRDALRSLGVDARVGEVPGEYCPGAHSVNARGRRKLMGVGQRLVRGAAHVGGVVVVRRSERVRGVLEPVYRALEHPFAPETTGSVEDELGGVTCEAVAAALVRAFARRFALEPAEIPEEALARAAALAPRHRVQDDAKASRSCDDASASSERPASTTGESWKKTWGMPS